MNVAMGLDAVALPSFRQQLLGGLLLLLVPPLAAGVLYGAAPLAQPSGGAMANLGFLLGVVPVELALCGFGLGRMTLGALNVPATTGRVLSYTIPLTLGCTLAIFIGAVCWRFPAPYSALWGVSAAFICAFHGLFSTVFGRTYFLNIKLVKQILPLAAVALLPGIFLVVFCFYRAAYSRMSDAQQSIICVLWPIIKMGFKKVSAVLLEVGGNPDMAPFLLFAFDSSAGLAGNFLFISANGSSSVFTMITLDMLENLIVGLRTLFLVQTIKSLQAETDRQRNSDEIARLERLLCRTIDRKRNDHLERAE